MSPKTDKRKFRPFLKVIEVFASRSREEISSWRGSRRSLGGLVFQRFPRSSRVFHVTWKIVVEPWQNMAAKNHSLNLFYHVEIPRLHRGTVTLKYHVSTNTININLIGNFSFQKFVYIIIIIIKLICSIRIQTKYLINDKHEG